MVSHLNADELSVIWGTNKETDFPTAADENIIIVGKRREMSAEFKRMCDTDDTRGFRYLWTRGVRKTPSGLGWPSKAENYT